MIRDDQIAMIFIARLVGMGALTLLLGALGFQYLAHLAPCEMCHWQRWPYIAAAIMGVAGLSIWKGDSRFLTIPVILLVAILAVVITRQWQNVIFVAVAALALSGIAATQSCARGVAIITILLVAVSGLIGLYQTGMQYHLLPGPEACTAPRYVIGSGAPPPEVSCDVPTWFLFGLALPAYNAIFAFLIAGMGAFLLSRKHAA
jgi:disulfide bond formation protein DsbB